ncbi:MAG TPA: long-chain fatty acid--CoA ligase [Acidimicrobiales bacterium]
MAQPPPPFEPLVTLVVTITNIAAILDGPAAGDAERPALVMADGAVWTYAALHAEVERWAASLAVAGVAAGDRVALADWGGARSTDVTLAAAHLGAATAQMNPLLTTSELTQLVDLCGSARVGVGPALAAAGPKVLDAPGDDGPPPARSAGGDDDALVLFTSGTTGLPKPVPISHAAVLARVGAYRPAFAADRPPSTSLMCVPSFHVGGMLGLLLSLWSGDTTVIQPRFDPGEWLRLVAAHRVTSVFLVPTMLARILDHPERADTDLSSLALVSYGAAAAPVDLVRRAMAAWPHAGFANVFGQTETLGAYTTLSPADHRDPARVGSVGRPLPGVEVRVVDPVTGADVDAGGTGELWVRSPQNVREGWLHTGDLGRLDADGYLYPTGRITDTINRGGEKFAPAEVADALRGHPAIADVAVAGVPDDEMGERVGVALVVRAGAEPPTVDALRDWCRGRLAPFKLPEVVAVVDALPYNELGKLPRTVTAALIGGSR